MKKIRKDKKGFTLIELIVVLAIIAILAVIIAPRFINFSDNARDIADEANAKSLYEAAMILLTDNPDALNIGHYPDPDVVREGGNFVVLEEFEGLLDSWPQDMYINVFSETGSTKKQVRVIYGKSKSREYPAMSAASP